MDRSVIKKIIKHYGETSTGLNYENPLLDKKIADLVSKGFIKLLNEESSKNKQIIEENSKKKQRQVILQNIRKSCKVEPTKHMSIDDNVTEILRNAYEELLDEYNIKKMLDSFLMRDLKEIEISSLHSPSFKPDIIQALVNLNGDKREIHKILLKDILCWNIDSGNENSYLHILESMWNEECVNRFSKTQPDDISIKMKPLIEKTLLPSVLEMLSTVIIDEADWFHDNVDLKRLSIMCCVSSECFQICCSMMNTIFMKTNFDKQMHTFINLFIDSIRCNVEYISQLYPSNLQHIVLLLDIELNQLDGVIKSTYIAKTLEHLQSLHKECANDVIMLLSHFNQWFNLYYDNK